MVSEPKAIEVEPRGEIDRLLDDVASRPVRLDRKDERFRLVREDDDVWAGYEPERARAGMRAAAGKWTDLDAEAVKASIYRAREEGSRPPDRP